MKRPTSSRSRSPKRKRVTDAPQWAAELGEGLPPTIDLREPDLHLKARQIADELIHRTGGVVDSVRQVDLAWRDVSGLSPVLLLGAQLAVSKLLAATHSAKVTVVMAVFKEAVRLLPCTAGNLNGEDCLQQKLLQLDWLLGDRWDMLIVDDGCPQASGEKFAARAAELGKAAHVRVEYLQKHVGTAGLPPAVAKLKSAADSRKGGAIILGLDLASKGCADDHVIAYTDADLSADLALLGLFIDKLKQKPTSAAIGARFGHRHQGSCWVTAAGPHTLGEHDRKFLTARHFFRSKLLPPLTPIIDTQCGLKAFPASVLRRIVPTLTDTGSTFDMELMLLTAIDKAAGADPLKVVPIVWCDSVLESNFIRTNDSQFKMLKTLAGIQKTYADRLDLQSKAQAEARAYGRFVGSLTRESYDRFMDRLESFLGRELNFNMMSADLTIGDFIHLGSPPLYTTVIGSWPKPSWLFGANPVSAGHSRGATASLWAAEGAKLKELQEKATGEAVSDMLKTGLTVISDGEMRRENYVFYHLQHIEGVDFNVLTDKVYRGGTQHKELPTVTQKVRTRHVGYLVDDFRKTVALTAAGSPSSEPPPVKVTLPGPMTIIDTTANSFYKTEEELAMDIAETLRVEIEALVEAGCTHVQVDEPVLVRYPEKLPQWGLKALNRCFEGIHGAFFTIHICCGYATGKTEDGKEKKAPGQHYNEVAPYMAKCIAHSISLEHTYKPLDLPSISKLLGPRKVVTLGLVSSCRNDVEDVDDISKRLQSALQHFSPHNVICCADCGMVMCTQPSALQKSSNLVAAAARVRASLKH